MSRQALVADFGGQCSYHIFTVLEVQGQCSAHNTLIRWTPPHSKSDHKVYNEDYIRVHLYSYYTTITGWGGPPDLLM